MRERKYLVLLSGGQDSATSLAWTVMNQGRENVAAIGFNYGQKHARELEQAAKIAGMMGVPFEVVNIQGSLADSSLIDHSQDVSAPHRMSPDLPSSFTPGRNALFLTIAGSRAFSGGFTDLVTGVCQTDFSGYPDCRRVFIDAMETALSLALGIDLCIHTPLMYLDKAETFRLAKDMGCLDLIIQETLTDYNGDMTLNEWGRGREDNPASKLRAEGFRKAKERGWI